MSKKDDIKFYVYKTTNLVNGKFYIGVHGTHKEDDYYLGSGVLIKKAIKKYGKQNFKKETLYAFDNCQDAYNKEAEIVTKDFVVSDKNYNLYVGGLGGLRGFHISEERRKELSKNMSGEGNPRFGVKLSQYTRDKMSKSRKGFKVSDETKKKLSIRNSGSGNPMFGYEWSDEQRLRARNSQLGKKHSEESKNKMSISRSGEGNHMWGKKHSEETRKRISEALKNSSYQVSEQTKEKYRKSMGVKRVFIDGKEYRSAGIAGKVLGISRQLVGYRVKSTSEKYENWTYLD